MTRLSLLFVLGSALALAACGGAPPSTEVPQIPPPPDVAAAPADAARTSTNLASKVITPGSGTRHPRPNSRVMVHYTGWTTDGRTFDSSVSRGEPATFGLDEVIPGWTEGVQMMVEGEKRRFWIPGRLAYEGAPGRPQGTLVFDIELIRIIS
jgi:peptidylprolyl isomerase